MSNPTPQPNAAIRAILHDFGLTYRVGSREEREADIDRAEAAILAEIMRVGIRILEAVGKDDKIEAWKNGDLLRNTRDYTK